MIFNIFKIASGVFAITTLAIILSILLKDSYFALKSIQTISFFSGNWSPSNGEFNIFPMIFGSLVVSIGALLLVAPISWFSSLAITFLCPKPLAFLSCKLFELMSGIPSVIFGLWGLSVLVPVVGSIKPPGASLLAASLVLCLMVLPSTILLFCQSIESIPSEQMSASNSLSLSLMNRVRLVVFPFLLPRFLSILCLQFARTLGETMAVVMVAGNIPILPKSLLDPIRTLTGHIALEMPYAEGLHRSSLMFSGLLLCLPSLLLFYFARKNLDKIRHT